MDDRDDHEFKVGHQSTARLVFRTATADDLLNMPLPETGVTFIAPRWATPRGCSRGGVTFVVRERETGEAIGQAGYQQTSCATEPAEITLWIYPEHWGRGLGTEAAHALIDHAFSQTRLVGLSCAIRVTNTRARRVLEKSGFQFRGSGMVHADEGAYPVEHFALARRDWASLKAWGAGPSCDDAFDDVA